MHSQAEQVYDLCRCSGRPGKPHKLHSVIHWQSVILGSEESKSKCGSESLQTEERTEKVSPMFWITQPYKELCRIESAQPLFTALKEKWYDPYILREQRCVTDTRRARILRLPPTLGSSLSLPWQLHTEKAGNFGSSLWRAHAISGAVQHA